MIFKIFRVILIILSLIVAILEIFAVTGSYSNKQYLTNTYLINFHIDALELTNLINYSQLSKRETNQDVGSRVVAIGEVTRTRNRRAPAESGWYYVPGGDSSGSSGSTPSWWTGSTSSGSASSGSGTSGSSSSGASGTSGTSGTSGSGASGTSGTAGTTGGYYTTVSQAVHDLLTTVNPQTLGMAQVYSVGYWGYCRGIVVGDSTNGGNPPIFDNKNVNYTWCSDAKANFFFNPVDIFISEMNHTVNGVAIDSQSSAIDQLSYTQKSQLKVLIDNLEAQDLSLPGNLDSRLGQLHNLTSASFGLLFAVAILSFVSVLIQLLAFCFSPEKCCLSFLNFLFEATICLLAIVGAALATGAYSFVRGQVNDNTDSFGVKSFLSINFYAFIWSAAVASILVVFFNLLGHCCGIFGSRKHYRTIRSDDEHHHHHKEETDSD
ncbi:hypothetical protein SBY92_000457 [Candida maltosa Xu316]